MWKIIRCVVATLGIVILFLFAGLLGFAAYDVYQYRFGSDQEYVEQPDSTQVCECQGSILDKTYVCADDVISDHQQLVLEVKYIDGFRDVSEETIKNVVNMLLRQRPSITIADIVNEYLANKNIYDNIQPNSVVADHDPDPVATDEPYKKLEPNETVPDTTIKPKQ